MIYVVAQFLLLALIFWPAENLQFSGIGLLLICTGALIAIMAIKANKPGNFNVLPEPKKAGNLITHGIYSHIRHPMYSSLFCAGLGITFCQLSVWKLAVWLLLVITLMLKARFEEKQLLIHFSDYKHYQKTTKAFIPFIW